MSNPNKFATERNQRAVLELAAKPGNDVCADCKARNPRWASHNLGIFICVNCASIHRKIGTHVSKVKSLTLDEWTKDQVEFMRQNGNLKSNAYYNPNESRNPPPTRMMENERDSELELFIRSKYEHKRFIDKSALVAAKLGPSRPAPVPASQSSRAVSSPIVAGAPTLSSQSALGINRPSTSALLETSSIAARQPAARSASHPLPPSTVPLNQQYMKPMPPLPSEARPQHPQAPQPPSDNPVWNDLISLSQPTVSASLPLQMQSTPTQMPQFNAQPNQSF
ncbi:hypothetical protein PLEOSDRAFT_1051872, partial [Pleurotus ostreatus PC15]